MSTALGGVIAGREEDGGAVNLASGGELAFTLDGKATEGSVDAGRQPVEVGEAHHSEVHDTVAEMMIFANAAVARRIQAAYVERKCGGPPCTVR